MTDIVPYTTVTKQITGTAPARRNDYHADAVWFAAICLVVAALILTAAIKLSMIASHWTHVYAG